MVKAPPQHPKGHLPGTAGTYQYSFFVCNYRSACLRRIFGRLINGHDYRQSERPIENKTQLL